MIPDYFSYLGEAHWPRVYRWGHPHRLSLRVTHVHVGAQFASCWHDGHVVIWGRV